MRRPNRNLLSVNRSAVVRATALIVGIHGGFLLASTLVDQLAVSHHMRISAFDLDIPLLLGLSLIYLSSVLLKRKWTAWLVAIAAYAFMLALYTIPFMVTIISSHADPDHWARSVALPVVILALLVVEHKAFVVRSDYAAFRSSVKFAVIILLAALLYGTVGFLLLDVHDFHQELTLPEAVHRTVDQFDLTTNHPLQPHSRRAHIFQDSLSVVSVGALSYVVVSFFRPLRARWHDTAADRRIMATLLATHKAPSEDFFKLWPHDKQYYFNKQQSAGIAFHTYRGVALCLADPVGEARAIAGLLAGFDELCFQNDWLPALIHTEERHHKLYEKLGFSLQKLGQEAVVDIAHYEASVKSKRYFRHIRNRFDRENYNSELLLPPHHDAVLARLRNISNEWLSRPGRVERGFVMGYYSDTYMQQCPVLVARDAAGTIQGFMNQVPAVFDQEEATFDMLRQTDTCLGNTNDYLLMNFIDNMARLGYKRVNLGLAPLVGIDEGENKGIVDNFLRFAYANGDRFYSFSGLHRFKAKYEPQWRDRYVVYRGGVRGFARTMNALLRVMQVKKHH